MEMEQATTETPQKPKKALTLPLQIAFAVILLGSLCYSMDWPWPFELTLVAAGAIAILYPFRYALKGEKVFLDHVKLPLVVLTCLNFFEHYWVWDIPFALDLALDLCLLVIWFIWFLNEGLGYLFTDRSSERPSSWAWLLGGASLLLIIVGTFMSEEHAPWDSVCKISGSLGCLAWLIWQMKFSPKA